MTETPESNAATSETIVPAPRHDDRDQRPNRLYQVLAWVGIAAGVVFIVALIFFSGFVAGHASGGHHGGHHGYESNQMGPRGSMMRHGGVGPGGTMGSGQPSATTTPTSTSTPQS